MDREEIGTLMPYVFDGVTWSISDDTMLAIWKMLLDAKIVNKLFFGMDMTVQGFFSLIKSPTNMIHIIFLPDLRPAMMAWLNSWGYNYAFAHFTGFPWTWGQSEQLIRQTIDYWFGFKRKDGTPMLDILFGLTPADNRLALRVIQRAGLKVLTKVPQIQFGVDPATRVGGVYTILTREDYENGRRREK